MDPEVELLGVQQDGDWAVTPGKDPSSVTEEGHFGDVLSNK